MQYHVINSKRVEINGVVRSEGDVLDADDFRSIPDNRPTDAPPELSELDSLLASGHVEAVED